MFLDALAFPEPTQVGGSLGRSVGNSFFPFSLFLFFSLFFSFFSFFLFPFSLFSLSHYLWTAKNGSKSFNYQLFSGQLKMVQKVSIFSCSVAFEVRGSLTLSKSTLTAIKPISSEVSTLNVRQSISK